VTSLTDAGPADFTRAGNHAAVAPVFARKFGRPPLPITDPGATINDLIFARMIDPDWTALERKLVDKVTAKQEALRLFPSLRIAATLAAIEMDEVHSPADLFERLGGFIGADAIAKPSQASGGTVFLRQVSGPANLAALHALATTEYTAVMREMQYAGLPRRVIVEALIPTADGLPPDDYKFHCINGEPLLCQIDHARFGSPWGRIFRVPGFEPMDAEDGLDWPDTLQPPDPEHIATMIAAARALSKPFDYVRVDLYNGLDSIYFGELTFTPSASLGIAPSKYGSHRVSATHRLFSSILMDALRTGRS
jgi:hypothetical protein